MDIKVVPCSPAKIKTKENTCYENQIFNDFDKLRGSTIDENFQYSSKKDKTMVFSDSRIRLQDFQKTLLSSSKIKFVIAVKDFCKTCQEELCINVLIIAFKKLDVIEIFYQDNYFYFGRLANDHSSYGIFPPSFTLDLKQPDY